MGSTDIDLVKGALERAREMGERLRPEGIRAIYTSQLKRAWKTAEAIGDVLGIKPVRMEDLNETDFGEWEMKWIGDIKKDYPDLWKARKRYIWSFRGHGGESYGQGRDRVMPFIEDLFRKHKGETFVVVSHGALLKIVYSTLTGLPIEKVAEKHYEPLYALFFKKHGDKIELEKLHGDCDG